MGLDMYLNRYKLHGRTVTEARKVEALLDYQNYLDNPNRRTKENGEPYSFKEWTGFAKPKVAPEAMEALTPEYYAKYAYWDTDKSYAHNRIDENVGYWRKANQIHNWFVENVQKGVDDCREYKVSRKQLIKLRDICLQVLNLAKTEDGRVHVGTSYSGGKVTENFEDGKVITNANEVSKLLPSTSGFFFGSTDYDEWYLRDVEATVKIIQEVLATTDFKTEAITYRSSW